MTRTVTPRMAIFTGGLCTGGSLMTLVMSAQSNDTTAFYASCGMFLFGGIATFYGANKLDNIDELLNEAYGKEGTSASHTQPSSGDAPKWHEYFFSIDRVALKWLRKNRAKISDWLGDILQVIEELLYGEVEA